MGSLLALSAAACAALIVCAVIKLVFNPGEFRREHEPQQDDKDR